MALRLNKKWRGVDWQPSPSMSAADLALDYAKRVQDIDRVQGVWARADGSVLHLYTLIEEDRETEHRLHATELEFFDAWHQPPVDFHIYVDRAFLESIVGESEPILVRVG